MDKYTVDLDKVLNDFEYSELTEQNNGYTNNSSPHASNQNVFGANSSQLKYETLYSYDNPPTYSKTPAASTKHSINNVFHSLNEYLNSDIKTELDKPGSSLSEINEIETNTPTLVRKTSKDKNDVSSIQDIFKSISKDEDITIVDNLTPTSDKFTSNTNSETQTLTEVKTINNNLNSKLNLNEINDTTNNTVENIEDSSKTNSDSVVVKEELVEEIVNDLIPDLTEDSEPDKIEESKTIVVPEDNEIVLVRPVGFEEIEVSDTEVENELAELEEQYKNITTEDPKIVETSESIEEKDLKSELEEIKSSPNKTNNEPTVIANFDKQCETDLQTIEDNEETIESSITNEENEEIKHEVQETVEEKTIDNTEINEEVFEDTVEEQVTPVVEEMKQIESQMNEEKQNEDLKIEEPKIDEEKIEDTSVVVKEDVSVREEDKVIEEIVQKVDENLEDCVEKVEEVQDEPIETISEDCDVEVKTERRNSVLLRPNSLDLNSESTSENLTINLIGEPGSTPYNNVYSETSLHPDKNTQTSELLEADNEASNSLSPTLSDASTYDNSDSPNTSDSCNDTSLEEHSHEAAASQDSAAGGKTSQLGGGQARDEPPGGGDGGETAGGVGGEGGMSAMAEAAGDQASWLGKTAPFWTPDSDAVSCLHCNKKFTVINRRHHCRACGLVLCSKCCNMKFKLQFMDNAEARVCCKCYDILSKSDTSSAAPTTSSSSDQSPEARGTSPRSPASPAAAGGARLNPNNPMEYCSTVPPHQQVAGAGAQPPSVMVPVGVLKRKGSGKARSSKSVMFCDGIRPGCDLTELDHDFNYKSRQSESSSSKKQPPAANTLRSNRNLPKVDAKTSSYIPAEENGLPPIVNVMKSDIFYTDCSNNNSLIEMLRKETITFAIQRNFHVQVRIINMDCCINKSAWCFTTEGMIAVGQDEIVILLEFIDNEKFLPKDVFLHLNNIYNDAVKGTSITEMGISIHPTANFLESKNHAGFLFIKPTFQCIQNVILPKEPYLVGILIHRWETPWAKIFPLRLLLRLGAEYRYYPSPIISTRHRESVYVEIGHTIINLLADFRNFSYTIPSVRGLTIHMEEKNTTVSIPTNRYDQVMKAVNNSSDYILAFAANFSPKADSHLVCIQDTHGNNENAYTTHAINIHNKPRKVTGASFIVINGALKSTSGLTAKSSIIEDGLMIQILPDQMVKLRTSLRNMKDFKINCGCVNAQSDESVSILWTENDTNFNIGVLSSIDNMSLGGIPSIRVHNGKDYVCNSGNKMIRWTEVFIIQSGEETTRTQDPVDISKLSESVSKATCQALVKYLDLLATNSCTKIGIRTTLHVENVSYLAGSNGTKLPPIYMKSLDNELIPVLHRITANFGDQASVVLELLFHILNV